MTVGVVSDKGLLEQVYGLRYSVNVEECGKPYSLPKECRRRRMLFDALDDSAHQIVATDADNRVIGAVRVNSGSCPQTFLANREKFPGLGILAGKFGPERLGFVSRLVVAPGARGKRRLVSSLALECYRHGVQAETFFGLIHTSASLVRLFERLGFDVVGEEFLDSESGTRQIPMIISAYDVERLVLIGSPFAAVWTDREKNAISPQALESANWFRNDIKRAV